MASLTTKPLCQHGFIFPMISTPLPAKFKLPIQTFALHCTYKNNLVMIKCENTTAINQTIKAPFLLPTDSGCYVTHAHIYFGVGGSSPSSIQ